MSKIYGSRKVVVLVLLILVLAPWPLAAQERPTSVGISDLLGQVWSFLVQAWQAVGSEEAVTPSYTDPSSAGSTDPSDAGMQVDPWG